MTSNHSSNIRFLAGIVLGCALALFVSGSGIHYKNLLRYTERNYMRSRKNERKLKRYGARMSDHELRLQKVEGFGR
jgi:hypothetical protein